MYLCVLDYWSDKTRPSESDTLIITFLTALSVKFSYVLSYRSLVSVWKPSVFREIVSQSRWMELNWSCVAHRPHLSLLMCCHKAAASSTHERPRESSGIISSGAEHMNVWLREHLCDQGRNDPDSLWLGSFRLSASLCVRFGARAGRGPLAVPCPELRACRFPSPLAAWLWDNSALYTSPSTAWDDSWVIAMSTVNYFTLHRRCWLGPPCL